jgi:hypothetical protein
MLSTPPAATATELTEKRMFMLFPTPMFMGKLPDMSVCDRVEKKVRELQKSGKGRAAPKGASPAWMSPDDLYDLPEMKELVDVIMWESGRVLDAFAVKRDSHYITSMWANNHSSKSSPGHPCSSELLLERSRLYQDAQ